MRAKRVVSAVMCNTEGIKGAHWSQPTLCARLANRT